MPTGVYQHKKHSEETRKRIGENNGNKDGSSFRNKKHSEKTKQKVSNSLIGHEYWGNRLSCFKKGKENPSYVNGLSQKNPYPKEFNSKLKLKIRIRDSFICCLCKRTEREEIEELNRVLSVNHIDFDKNNCKESNLNTLCDRCNARVNWKRSHYLDYFRNLMLSRQTS